MSAAPSAVDASSSSKPMLVNVSKFSGEGRHALPALYLGVHDVLLPTLREMVQQDQHAALHTGFHNQERYPKSGVRTGVLPVRHSRSRLYSTCLTTTGLMPAPCSLPVPPCARARTLLHTPRVSTPPPRTRPTTPQVSYPSLLSYTLVLSSASTFRTRRSL